MNYKTYEVRAYTDGYKEWYLNGKLHREDGPAIEYPSGYKAWYLNDKRVSEEELPCVGPEVTIDGVTYILKVKAT